MTNGAKRLAMVVTVPYSKVDIINIDKEPTETHSVTFETLTRDKKEPDFNVSGKLLTDEEKIDNKEYLDSVEGLQINIEGSFQ